jgi:hypothetical protein
LLAEALFATTDYLVLALTLTNDSCANLLAQDKKLRSKVKQFAVKCDVTSDKDAAKMKVYA